MRQNEDGIHLLHQILDREVGRRHHLHPIDEAALVDDFIPEGGIADEAQTGKAVFCPQLSAGHALGAIEIHHLAILLQVVELPDPVGAHRENIHSKPLDIINFLPLILFHNNLIGDTESLHGLDAFHQGLFDIDFPTGAVESVGGNAHNQVVAQLLGPLQQADMSVMQQIVSSVCDYFFHKYL